MYLILFEKVHKFKIYIPNSFWTLYIPYFIYILGIVYSDDLNNAIKFLIKSIAFLIIPVIVLIIIQISKINLKLILISFLLSVLTKFLIFFLNFIDFEVVFRIKYWEAIFLKMNQLVNLNLFHPSYFSLYIGFLTLWITFEIFETKRYKNVKFIFFILGFFINVIIFSKMPLVSFILLLFILIFYYSVYLKNNYFSFTLSFFLLLIIFFLLNKIPNDFKNDYNNYNNLINSESNYPDLNKNDGSFETWKKTNRLYIWKCTISIIEKYPLLGVGTGDSKNMLKQEYLNQGYLYAAKVGLNTHNQYLSFILKFGLVGICFIFIFIFLLYRNALHKHDILYLLFLTHFLICCLTENYFARQWGIIYFTFFNSIFYLNNLEYNSKTN